MKQKSFNDITTIYNGSKAYITVHDMVCVWFRIDKRIRQGYVLGC